MGKNDGIREANEGGSADIGHNPLRGDIMSTLDIRKRTVEQVTEIQFDASSDRVFPYPSNPQGFVYIGRREIGGVSVAYWSIDDLIAALQKAKELWGPK